MATHTARQHPEPEVIAKTESRDLWTYVLGELDFLSTPEQKRVPYSLSLAMHELARRGR